MRFRGFHLQVVNGLRRSWRLDYIARARPRHSLYPPAPVRFSWGAFYPWNKKPKRKTPISNNEKTRR